MKAAEQRSNKAPDLGASLFTFSRMSAIEDRLLVLIVDLHSSVSRHVCLVGADLSQSHEFIAPSFSHMSKGEDIMYLCTGVAHEQA